jgi:hypothetical protein
MIAAVVHNTRSYVYSYNVDTGLWYRNTLRLPRKSWVTAPVARTRGSIQRGAVVLGTSSTTRSRMHSLLGAGITLSPGRKSPQQSKGSTTHITGRCHAPIRCPRQPASYRLPPATRGIAARPLRTYQKSTTAYHRTTLKIPLLYTPVNHRCATTFPNSPTFLASSRCALRILPGAEDAPHIISTGICRWMHSSIHSMSLAGRDGWRMRSRLP